MATSRIILHRSSIFAPTCRICRISTVYHRSPFSTTSKADIRIVGGSIWSGCPGIVGRLKIPRRTFDILRQLSTSTTTFPDLTSSTLQSPSQTIVQPRTIPYRLLRIILILSSLTLLGYQMDKTFYESAIRRTVRALWTG
jgi:hypothetical protein